MKIELSIALPIYNEEANIKDVVSTVEEKLKNYIDNFEIIAVNDGSEDETLNILNEIKFLYPELKIVSHAHNMGYGSALRTCIKCAKGEWIFFMDADGQFTMENFETLWARRSEYDFILGYRKNRQDGCYRLMLGKFGNLVSNLLLRRNIKDVNCGFKLFRKTLLQKIPFISTGGLIYFEMLLHLLKQRRKFTQLPVRHYKRKKGTSNGGRFRTIVRIIVEGIKCSYAESKRI